MKKLSKALVACAAMAAMATPAYAIQADFTGFFQARGFAYDNMNGDDRTPPQGLTATTPRRASGVDQRLRLWTNAALHENVKATFGIEVDNIWGRVAPTGKEVGAPGADAKAEIEIKHLFLDFNIPFANTNVKAGTQFFRLGGGFIIADDAAGMQVRYTPVQGQSLLLAWVKTREGNVSFDSQDADYYHLQYDTSFAGWKVSPYVGYFNMASNVTIPADATPAQINAIAANSQDLGDEAFFFGIDVAGKIGPVAIAATIVGNDWDNGITSGNGLAAMVKGTYVMGPTTFTAEVARYGDSDRADGRFVSLRQGAATGGYNNFAEIITGGRFDGRTGMRGGQTFTSDGIDNPYIMNYQYAKLGAEHKFDDRHKVSAFYIFAEEAESVGDRGRITFGHEIDAYYDYAISKGLTFSVGGGYLIADSDFGAGDDAWKVGTAITYTF